MDLAIMVEGQEGVGWEDWRRLAEAAEAHGYQALLRSDHYFSVAGNAERGALDAWGTINALAAITGRIRLGTLVSPVTFRPAAVLAKLALTADHVSGGRIDVGMGTGWWQAEHERYGFPFPPMRERMDELERQLGEVTRYWSETPPAPVQRPRPRLVMGGRARRRSAALAARYADEYNFVAATPEQVREPAAGLRAATDAAGREPLALSVMTGFVIGADEEDTERRAERLMIWRGESGDVGDWLRARAGDGWIVGSCEQAVARLREYEAAGIERVALQHNLFTDLDVLALIGREVLPAVAG